MLQTIKEAYMATYSLEQWIFLFFSYSIMGWMWESVYMSILEKKVLNRGFLYGPFIPLYGAGATLVLFFTLPFKRHWWAVAVIGMLVATILEEVTGRVMDFIFDVRYWTYEGYPGNIDDIICVPATLLWGVFSLFAAYIMNRPFDYLLGVISPSWVHTIVYIISMIFVVDVTLSIKQALDFKLLLTRMEKGKEEILRLKKRLDVMIAFYDLEHSYGAKLKERSGNQLYTPLEILNSVRTRLEIMNEIRKSRKIDENNEDEQFKELTEIERSLTEQETEERHYRNAVRRHIVHLLSTNPKAKIKRIGGSLKELSEGFKERSKWSGHSDE